MIMIRNLLVILTLVLFSSSFVTAQMPGMMGARNGGNGQNMNIGHFYGKVVDTKTGKAVEGVTVQLKGNKFDTVTKKMKEAILGTIITPANGDFSFDGLPVFGNFKHRPGWRFAL